MAVSATSGGAQSRHLLHAWSCSERSTHRIDCFNAKRESKQTHVASQRSAAGNDSGMVPKRLREFESIGSRVRHSGTLIEEVHCNVRSRVRSPSETKALEDPTRTHIDASNLGSQCVGIETREPDRAVAPSDVPAWAITTAVRAWACLCDFATYGVRATCRTARPRSARMVRQGAPHKTKPRQTGASWRRGSMRPSLLRRHQRQRRIEHAVREVPLVVVPAPAKGVSVPCRAALFFRTPFFQLSQEIQGVGIQGVRHIS
jgi:hypothetical protein